MFATNNWCLLICIFLLSFFFFIHSKCTTFLFFFFQAEDGIRDADVTGVQTCALPIFGFDACIVSPRVLSAFTTAITPRSEEHTSELQSRPHLVCRLLLEKKKKKK